MSIEQTLIIECPKCGKCHQYRLDVEITSFIGWQSTSIPAEFNKVSIWRFTRLFNCPEKNENFQATIKLTETGGNRIESVRVVGVIKEGVQE